MRNWWGKGLLVATLTVTVGRCAGATITVSGSIREAVARASAGDKLLIPGGSHVYRERLVIDKPLELIGVNQPVIDGGGTGTVIRVTAPGATLRELRIRNSGADLAALDAAVVLEAPKGTVVGCAIHSPAFGIYLRAASHCQVENNVISGPPGVAPSARGNGIHLWKTKTNAILRNLIFEKRDGVYLSFADHTLLESNLVRRTRFGIHYMYSHYNTLRANELTANAVGATLMFSQQSAVESNVAHANRRHGMVLKQLDNSRVIGNRVTGNNRGLFVQQSSMNRFERNLVATNDIGLYLSTGSEQNVFTGNFFVNNVDQVWQPPYEADLGRQAPNRFFEDVRGNYWSDYTGWDRNGDGVGDTPYHETDVFGYLLDRYPDARMFSLSPALALIRKGEQLLPVLDTVGVVDLFPIAR